MRTLVNIPFAASMFVRSIVASADLFTAALQRSCLPMPRQRCFAKQALFSTFSKSDSLAPAMVAGAVSAALFTASRLGRIPDALKPLMRNLLGWTATLLFMFQPLAQLVRATFMVVDQASAVLLRRRCHQVGVFPTARELMQVPCGQLHRVFVHGAASVWFSAAAWHLALARRQSAAHAVAVVTLQINNFEVPTSLEGLSLGTILLALVGNGLMVPRALFTRDSIWLLGSAWGSSFGWLQLLSMFVGRSATGCASDRPHAGGMQSVLRFVGLNN